MHTECWWAFFLGNVHLEDQGHERLTLRWVLQSQIERNIPGPCQIVGCGSRIEPPGSVTTVLIFIKRPRYMYLIILV
jgi:hypothetical protein